MSAGPAGAGKLRYLYLVLCVPGLLLPYSQLAPWLRAHGLSPSLFAHDLFANGVAGFFAMDVLVSAVVLLVFVAAEGRRLGMRLLWLPVVTLLVVGVSLALPLFLYLRQAHLDRANA